MALYEKVFEFVQGPLAGKTVRVEMKEIQKPHINRKTATPMGVVDRIERRPLDPPPVVSIRVFELENEGTPMEVAEELDPTTVAYSGFVSHVDLFPVARPEKYTGPTPQRQWTAGAVIQWPRPLHPEPDCATALAQLKLDLEREAEELEARKQTSKLFGCSFVNSAQIKDMNGVPMVVFVFSDLSVRVEGHFVLRYRCFDVFSGIDGSEDIPVCSEIWGEPFVVVGTKEFPGLKASTELTKHLAGYGIPVNWRGYGRSQKQLLGSRSDDDDDDATPAHQSPTYRYGAPPMQGNSYPSLSSALPNHPGPGYVPIQPLGYNPNLRPGFQGFAGHEHRTSQKRRAPEDS